MDSNRIQILSYPRRLLAFLIDGSVFAALFCLLYFLAFEVPFGTKAESELRMGAFLSAGLYVEEEGGYVLAGGESYESYMEIAKGYYVGTPEKESYFDTAFYLDHGGTRKPYTVDEFNREILRAEGEDDSSFFTLEGVEEGEYARLKDSLFEGDELSKEASSGLLAYFQEAVTAIFEDLYEDSFYAAAVEGAKVKTLWRQSLSYYLAYAVPSILLPLALGSGRSLGRLAVGALLLAPNGAYQSRFYALPRSLPALAVGLSLVFSADFYLFLILGVLLLVGNGLCMAAGPGRRSLYDRAGHGLLIDGRKSTPFRNASEAASYEEAAEQELLDISREYYRKGN